LGEALDKGFAGKLCCVRGRGVGVHRALEDVLHGTVNHTPKAMRIEGENTVFEDENVVIEGENAVLVCTARWRTCCTAPSTAHPS
jgi:hypothetical protein